MVAVLYQTSEKLAALLPPLLIDAERVAQSVWYGVHGRRRVGAGESFWQFRSYSEGDPAERIDWRQSARTDKLYVREREWEAAQSVCLWADMSGSMRYASNKNLPSKEDHARLLLLALASLLQRGGEKALWCDGREFMVLHGKAGLERVANFSNASFPRKRESIFSSSKMDARLRGHDAEDEWSAGHESLPPLPPMTRHVHMILASDFLMPPEALQERMQAYAAQSLRGALLHIVDPLEASFDLDGRVELQGVEGEAPLLLPSAASVRDAYRRKFAEHQAKLLHIAESAGWFYLRHVTSGSPQQTLLRLYRYLAG